LVAITISAFFVPAHAVSNSIHLSDTKQPQHPVRQYAEGELLVKFKPGTTVEEKAAIHRKFNSTVIKVFNSIGVEHISLREGLSVEEAIRLYKDDPRVEYAEPNYKAGIQLGSRY